MLLLQCYRFAHCEGSTRKGKSLCVHKTPMHFIASALHGLVATETDTMSQVMSPSTLTSVAPSNIVMRNGQATTIPLGSNWFTEIDVATGMEDFDHSGFVLERKASNRIQNSGFKMAKGIVKVLLAEFKRTIN